MDMIIPPLKIKMLFESNHVRSRILVRRLAVRSNAARGEACFTLGTERSPVPKRKPMVGVA